jgi:hypothetical protein
MKNQLRVTDQKVFLTLKSEQYVVYGRMGYVPVVDVVDIHSGEEGYLVISAVTLGTPLYELQKANGGLLVGLSVSVQKASSNRMSPYILEVME